MKAILEKLGQDPRHSLTVFLRGLGLFVMGLLFIGLGYFYHFYWQIIGIITLACGCLTAAWGYLGIFANRWLMIFSHQKKTANKTKNLNL